MTSASVSGWPQIWVCHHFSWLVSGEVPRPLSILSSACGAVSLLQAAWRGHLAPCTYDGHTCSQTDVDGQMHPSLYSIHLPSASQQMPLAHNSVHDAGEWPSQTGLLGSCRAVGHQHRPPDFHLQMVV